MNKCQERNLKCTWYMKIIFRMLFKDLEDDLIKCKDISVLK